MKKLAIVVSVLATAGTVLAQPKTPPAPDVKKAPPVTQKPADPMPMPKPAAELTALAKATSGTVKCTGKAFMPDNTALDMTGSMTSKADLDGFWIRDTFAGKMKMGGYKFESFTTYDATAKKWRRVQVDSIGGYLVGWSDGPTKDGKVDFALEGFGPMGPMMFKDHFEMGDAKTGSKSWGERSLDKGKTWSRDYEVACKK